MTNPPAATGLGALREQVKGVRFGWALITPSTTLCLSLATSAVASRWLEPAEFGRFAVAMAVLATIVPFAALGGPVILIRHLAGAGDHGQGRALRTAVYLAVLLESGLIIVVATLMDLLPGQFLGRWLSPGLAPVVAAGAAAAALVELRVSEDQAAFRFRRQFAALTGAAVIRLVGLLLALAVAPLPDHRAAVAGYVGGSVASALVMARSQLVGALRQVRASLAVVRHDVVRLGIPVAASSVLGVLTVHVDTLVAAAVLAPGDLAQYAAANRLSLIHATAIGGLTAIALPVAATLARRGSLDNYAHTVTRHGLVLGVVAVLLSIGLAPFAIQTLFGDRYGPSVMVFAVLSLGFLLNYPGNPLSQVLFMTHRTHIIVLVQLGQLATFAVAASTVAPQWGALGLAATRSATNLLAALVIGAASIGVARRLAVQAPAAHHE